MPSSQVKSPSYHPRFGMSSSAFTVLDHGHTIVAALRCQHEGGTGLDTTWISALYPGQTPHDRPRPIHQPDVPHLDVEDRCCAEVPALEGFALGTFQDDESGLSGVTIRAVGGCLAPATRGN